MVNISCTEPIRLGDIRNGFRRGISWVSICFAIAALASCAANEGDGRSDAQCAPSLTYKGRTYVGSPVERRMETSKSLGHAVREPCADGNSAGDRATRVPISAIEGVSPSVAFVTSNPKRRYVYWTGSRYDPPEAVEGLLKGR